MHRLVFLASFLLFTSLGQAVQYPKQITLAVDRHTPYDLTGQLYFTSGRSDYIGSGTVIKPQSVLTAGHNVFDPDTGWSTDVEFRRGAYGHQQLSDSYSTHLYLVAGYQQNATVYGPDDVRAFAYDTGGLVFPAALAAGASASYTTDLGWVQNHRPAVAIGYGAEGQHSGEYPLEVIPTAPFTDTYRSFFENRSIYVEGGMSGGPLFYLGTDRIVHVVAVIVSTEEYPYIAGGVRAIDTATVAMIRTYLR